MKNLSASASSCGPIAMNDFEDLEAAINKRLPEGVSRAGTPDQVATKQDTLDYFRTAPPHEVKIALDRINQVPEEQTARHLGMALPVYRAVSNQMLARFAAHRGDKTGSGLNVPSQQSTGVARREARGGPLGGGGFSNQPSAGATEFTSPSSQRTSLSPGNAILADLRKRRDGENR